MLDPFTDWKSEAGWSAHKIPHAHDIWWGEAEKWSSVGSQEEGVGRAPGDHVVPPQHGGRNAGSEGEPLCPHNTRVAELGLCLIPAAPFLSEIQRAEMTEDDRGCQGEKSCLLGTQSRCRWRLEQAPGEFSLKVPELFKTRNTLSEQKTKALF